MKPASVILLLVLFGATNLVAQIRLPNLERRGTNGNPGNPGNGIGRVVPAPQPKPSTADNGDPLFRALGDPRTRDRSVQTYREQGAVAVPGLLGHLQSANVQIRVLALSALQYAWSDEAIGPVMARLKSPEAGERKWAMIVLRQKLEPAELAKRLDPVLDQIGPEVVEEMLPLMDQAGADADRLRRVAAHDRNAKAVLAVLPRYQSADMIPLTRRLASRAKGEWRARAITALIHQGDNAAEARRAVLGWLRDKDPRVREYAAEYLRWHGDDTALAPLAKVLEHETDPWARAGHLEAVRVIKARSAAADDSPAFPTEAAIEAVCVYGQAFADADREQSEQRIAAVRAYAGYPHESAVDSVPPANKLLAPTRDYWESKNGSFGRKGGGTFTGSVHVGDDVSWERDQATVIAIAPGIVKQVRVGAESWGGIVVVEHEREDGSHFCSLYSHLGPLVAVDEGDLVAAGQKVGALGRSFTWEGGGYLAHLHFGMHEGAYGEGRWVSGYLEPAAFKEGRHNWLSPRALLRNPIAVRGQRSR